MSAKATEGKPVGNVQGLQELIAKGKRQRKQVTSMEVRKFIDAHIETIKYLPGQRPSDDIDFTMDASPTRSKLIKAIRHARIPRTRFLKIAISECLRGGADPTTAEILARSLLENFYPEEKSHQPGTSTHRTRLRP